MRIKLNFKINPKEGRQKREKKQKTDGTIKYISLARLIKRKIKKASTLPITRLKEETSLRIQPTLKE